MHFIFDSMLHSMRTALRAFAEAGIGFATNATALRDTNQDAQGIVKHQNYKIMPLLSDGEDVPLLLCYGRSTNCNQPS